MSAMQSLLEQQDQFFNSGATRALEYRLAALARLKAALQAREADFLAALKQDLGKGAVEAYGTEIALVYDEIDFIRARLRGWLRPQRVPTPLLHFPALSYRTLEPLGRVLIMAPWNYPYQLLLLPLVGALAAGNTVVLKPSELAPAMAALIAQTLSAAFPAEQIAVVNGGPETAQALLAERWGHIFFTGGAAVGRLVLQAAAEHLTPVTLELGGKSPVIVDATADIALAAKRIAWGKLFNAGQTCIAPDYVLVQRTLYEALLTGLKDAFTHMAGRDPLRNPDYPQIISQRHFERLCGLMNPAQVVYGGQSDPAARRIAPTLLSGVTPDDAVMAEEIFGPLLPVLPYDTLEDALAVVARRPNPLALYLFTRDRGVERRVMTGVPFGGGCINDVVSHVYNPHLPFGGRNASGLGSYHGRASVLNFSHSKSILKKGLWLDLAFRYPPYRLSPGLLKALFWLGGKSVG